MVLLAVRVKTRTTSRTDVLAAEILGNSEGVMAVAAQDRLNVAFVATPNDRRMASNFRVAVNTSIEFTTTLESYRDNVPFRVVVRTLSSVVNAHAADHHHGTSWIKRDGKLIRTPGRFSPR
jgi:hypothetical protein